MGNPFTAEQDAWLIKNHNPSVTIPDLCEAYNLYFGESRSKETMRHHCKRLGLRQERRNFTAEQDKWLAENAPFLSVSETADRFNAKFKTSRSPGVLKARCNRTLKVHHLNHKFYTGRPIGSESKHGLYTWIKVSDTCHGKASFYQNWKPKHRLVWEERNGLLPDGYTIIFLDGNRDNCSPNNLYAIDGKVLREMSKKKWFSKNRDITLAAIKWCELFYAVKEVQRGPLRQPCKEFETEKD